ncbi:MAG: phosphodiester glycosidase family protein [Myxococcota bacterium]
MTTGPRRAVVVILVLLGLGVSTVFMGRRPQGPIHLAKVRVRAPRPGVELVEGEVRSGTRGRGRLTAVFVDLAVARVELVLNPDRAPLGHLRSNPDAWLVANAGYFTEQHRPTGLLVNRGQVLHRFVPEAGSAGSGVLTVQGTEVRLFERDAVDPKIIERADVAVQAGPRIIEPDGSPGIRGDDGMRANRTVLGRDGRGRLALVVVYAPEAGLGVGPTLFELQQLLGPAGLGSVRAELSLDAALNLDGGPSTGLHFAGLIDLPPANRVVSVLRLSDR